MSGGAGRARTGREERRSPGRTLHGEFKSQAAQEKEESQDRSLHGDPFPIPLLPAGKQAKPQTHSGKQRAAMRESREARVREGILALNALSQSTGGEIRSPVPHSSARYTTSQAAVVSRIGSTVAKFPGPPKQSDDEALFELLRTRDMYDMEASSRVDFRFERVTILSSTAKAQPLA